MFIPFSASVKLKDDNSGYASAQDVALFDLDEECAERMGVRIRYGLNPSFAISNIKNNQAIGGIRLFASELSKVMLFMNESMSLYPDSALNKYGGHTRVDYQDNTWFKLK